MAFRLLVHLGDRTLRFPLTPGEHLLGSSSECDVRIRHPSISRRHAILSLTDEGVILTDQGSSNGTRVAGRSVRERAVIEAGATLVLGSVKAELHEVSEGDLEVGVSLPDVGSASESAKPPREGSASTVGPAVLEVFGLTQLPELVDRVARGETRAQVGQAVGEALFRSMPCRRVDLVRLGAEGEGVLFTGERGGSSEAHMVTADAGGRCELRVGFVGPVFAQTYEPLVRAAAGLIRAAGPVRARPSVPIQRPLVAPRPPDPPSVVAKMKEIYSQAGRVARGRVSVLVRGESGTGKELLARFLHAASDRGQAPLVTLNCAALPRDLLESELFGVEKGVATGVDARAGKFESAHGSTLFLDEIGDMALETQARILRVLQEGEVYRVGGQKARPADIRVLSASNRDLDAMLADGRFRRDLYHRIADWVVELPPLRDRRADIPNLAAHFLARACSERGVAAAGITRAAVDALMAFPWPGNVRQLEKEMGRAALFLEDGELLDTSRLQPAIVAGGESMANMSLKAVREQAEADHIRAVLDQCGGVVSDAARLLDVGLSTLYQRMKALGIE